MKESIQCFERQTDIILFGTELGGLYKILNDDTIQLIHRSDIIPITAIKSSKNGILYGLQNGSIFSMLIQDDVKTIECVKSEHRCKIKKYIQFF